MTGATGFIGSRLVRLLWETGRDKIVAVTHSRHEQQPLQGPVHYVRADVTRFGHVLNLVQAHRPVIIYHLGAMPAAACDLEPESGIHTNALGTFHVLEAARLFDVEQVVFASSLSIVGGTGAHDDVLDDYSLARPETVDGASKLFSESIGLFYRRRYGLDYRGLRLPVVIGRGARAHGLLEYLNNVVDNSIRGFPCKVHVAPGTRLPLLHVEDAARAFVDLARAPASDIRAANYIVLGPTPPPTAREFVDAVRARVPGAKIEFEVEERAQKFVDAVAARPFDDGHARAEWGWQYRYDADAMVEDFIAPEARPYRPAPDSYRGMHA